MSPEPVVDPITAPVPPGGGGGARVPALDGLRGVAIVAVFLFHTGHLVGGFLGVDLFFTLSGYLITGQLLAGLAATGTVPLGAFWGRRLRRLLPASAVLLTVVVAWVRVAGPPASLRAVDADGPWAQVGLVNWYLLAESASYWDRFGPGRPFGHLWSIAVEEQFYVVWPVVLLLAARTGARWRCRPGSGTPPLVAALALAGCSLAAMAWLGPASDPTRVYVGTDTRAFSLLVGAVAVCLPEGTRAWCRGRWVGVVSTLLLLGLALPWFGVDGVSTPGLYPAGLLAYAVATAALIVCCVEAPTTAAAGILAHPGLRRLGSISYGLYLWHWPVAVLLPTPPTGWWRTALVAAVSLVAATLSRHLVEDPVRHRCRWSRGRRGLLALGATMAWLSALWLLPEPTPPPVDIDLLG